MPQSHPAYRVEFHAEGRKEVHYAYGPKELRLLFQKAQTHHYTFLKISVLYRSTP